MNCAVFYRAALPEPHTILGLRLLPFSLGHRIILGRIESAFLDGSPIGYEDLAMAVFICSRTYEEGSASLSDPDLPRAMGTWARRLTGRAHWWNRLLISAKLKRPTLIELDAKAEAFRSYLDLALEEPAYSFEDDADGSTIDCPWPQLLKVRLMRDMGFSEIEVLNRPYALCRWDWLTLSALKGDLEFCEQENVETDQLAADAFDLKVRSLIPAGGLE